MNPQAKFLVRVMFNSGTIRNIKCSKLPTYNIDKLTNEVILTIYEVTVDKNLHKFIYEWSCLATHNKITYVGRI